MRTPFMVQGPTNLIPNLKRLGFRTFDQWWDEGYSQDPHDCQVPAMIENIKKLSLMSASDMELMYSEMTPVLDHNWHRLTELRAQDFAEVFGQ